MASHETPTDCQRLREDARHGRVSYEIYPDLTWQPADWPLTWFEIALRAGAEEYQPSGNPGVARSFPS